MAGRIQFSCSKYISCITTDRSLTWVREQAWYDVYKEFISKVELEVEPTPEKLVHLFSRM
jgi:hypothetical protein